jgi:hypothetical protein
MDVRGRFLPAHQRVRYARLAFRHGAPAFSRRLRDREHLRHPLPGGGAQPRLRHGMGRRLWHPLVVPGPAHAFPPRGGRAAGLVRGAREPDVRVAGRAHPLRPHSRGGVCRCRCRLGPPLHRRRPAEPDAAGSGRAPAALPRLGGDGGPGRRPGRFAAQAPRGHDRGDGREQHRAVDGARHLPPARGRAARRGELRRPFPRRDLKRRVRQPVGPALRPHPVVRGAAHPASAPAHRRMRLAARGRRRPPAVARRASSLRRGDRQRVHGVRAPP